MGKTMLKHSPSPARLCYFILDGIDHIPLATLSSGVTGHLGTSQVGITEGDRHSTCEWLLISRKAKQLLLLRETPQRGGDSQSKEKMPGS